MRVLVTGGAGYIGSHTARELARLGHEVVILDDLSTGHVESVGDLPLARVDLATGDVAGFLAERRFDAAIHFAAKALVPESVVNPQIYWRSNTLATVRLLDAFVQHGPKRIVFSSTCAVYGTPTEVPIPESHAKNPINPYGHSKLAIEYALEDYSRAYGLGAIALRYFNAAGAAEDGSHGEDHAEETHLIPLAMRSLLGGPTFRIAGTDYDTPDGTCIRDFIHIDDLARAHVRAVERVEAGKFEAINIGTGTGHSVREVLAAIERVTGRRVPAVEAPRRPGDPPRLVARNELARRRLELVPERTLEDIVGSAWRWHQRRPRGYGEGGQ
jgi:UDP-glucose 4-epimerase